MRKIPSLTKLIFEDIEDDIKAAYKAGPAAVRKLANSTPDKEKLRDALKGDHDKVEKDDQVPVGKGTPVKVGALIPTQNEIDLMKSIAFPLGGFDALKNMVVSKTSGAPGAITISGKEVLDGHHRWSGVWGISGPAGTIQVQNLKLPGDTSKKLAAAQLAIAAYKDPNVKQPSAEDPIPYNILGKDKAYIKQMILDNVGNQTDSKAPGPLLNDEMLKQCADDDEIAKWAGFKVGDDIETVKDKIADRVAENLGGAKPIPENPAAPARADMPQFDDKTIGGKAAKEAIYTGLQTGEFNVNPPFEPKNEGKGRSDDVIVERWAKLAGILKD